MSNFPPPTTPPPPYAVPPRFEVQPPSPTPLGENGPEGRWARWALAARLARREVRSRPGRHVLVVLMILVPVLTAMAAFSGVSTMTSRDELRREFVGGALTIEGRPGPNTDIDPATGAASTPAEQAASMRSTEKELLSLINTQSQGRAAAVARWEGADWLVTDRQQPQGLGPYLVGTPVHQALPGDRNKSRWVVDEGRLPTSANEIFLTRPLANVGDWQVGDRVTSGRTGVEFTVSGIGVQGDSISSQAAVVGPVDDAWWLIGMNTMSDVISSPDLLPSGPLEPEYPGRRSDDEPNITAMRSAMPRLEVAVTGPRTVLHELARSTHLHWLGGSTSWTAYGGSGLESVGVSMAIVLVTGGFAAVVAVVASAAFAIAARRQLRAIGLLSSVGADPATVRRSLILQGALPGLLAGVIALIITISVALVANGSGIAEQRLDTAGASMSLPVGGLTLAVTMAVVAGALAAWQPARTASRVPVLSALAGRRPVGPVPHRVPVTGAIVMAVGTASISVITGLNLTGGLDWLAGIVMLMSILAVVFGGIAMAPTLVALVGKAGGRFGGLFRLALRSLARNRTQAAATVAALAVCLAIPTGILTGVATSRAQIDFERRASAEHARSNPEVPTTIGPSSAPDATSVGIIRKNPEGVVLQVMGDLRSPRRPELERDLADKLGPLAAIELYAFADGQGGWVLLAGIDPAAAQRLMVPWVADQISRGGPVALSRPAGPVPIADPLVTVDQPAIAAPVDAGPPSLDVGLDADYLVPASVVAPAAATGVPTGVVLVGENRPTLAQMQAVDDKTFSPYDSGMVIPTLDELEARRDPTTPTAVADDPTLAGPVQDPGGLWVQFNNDWRWEDTYRNRPVGDHRDDDPRWMLILAAVTATVALVVLTITLSLRSIDGAEDARAAVAVGAPPARMARQGALEGVILALLGALLALPIGWLPVTAVSVGIGRGRFADLGSGEYGRIHLPTWELIPILLLPALLAGVLWTVGPALTALIRRGPRDQVLPRW